MTILITGSAGFVGRNLAAELKSAKEHELLLFDKDTDIGLLGEFCAKAEFVFHLAGVNRPIDASEFRTGNADFTAQLLYLLKKHNNKCPIAVSSSTQAALDNPYGLSKKVGEDLLKKYAKETSAKVMIYRLPNIFGKWCRPNYNSAVATFCHNIARGLPITVNNPETELTLVYIDDVVEEFKRVLTGEQGEFITHKATLGSITGLLHEFRDSRKSLSLPDLSDAFTKKLHATYLSYLPENEFSYPLKMNADERGSFTEFVRTADRGQFSVNITKPGITKGNHWHNTKNEKFLVVSGEAIIRFRRVDSDAIREYKASGEKLEVVDIPPGYTHNIENIGKSDLVTVMWANEAFDPGKPDTVFEEVQVCKNFA